MTNKQDLIERYEFAVQQLGEMEAEAANEVAMFGDSGPGSAIAIQSQGAHVVSLRNQLAKLAVGG